MNILIVAYACTPDLGSEHGAGWSAILRAGEDHNVYVLTDDLNRAGWLRAESRGVVPGNVRVRFLRKDHPYFNHRLLAHLQSWYRYRAFSNLVLKTALEWHNEVGFDFCHQVNIATWRMPSQLWQMPVPLIWGPIGGTGYVPTEFRSILSPSSRIFEKVRDVSTAIIRRSRAFRDCMREATIVLAANEETEVFLKPYRGELKIIRLPIISLPDEKIKRFSRPEQQRVNDKPLKLFAGGNIIGTKGVSLALKALAIVADKGIPFHYMVAGGGPEIDSLQRLSKSLGLANSVEFHPGLRDEKYIAKLHDTDIYLLPSFRESTPVTLIESILAGCYPVVANTSAQGEIVRMAGGSAVSAKTPDDMVKGLADALLWCQQNRDKMEIDANRARIEIIDHFSNQRYELILRDVYSNVKYF